MMTTIAALISIAAIFACGFLCGYMLRGDDNS